MHDGEERLRIFIERMRHEKVDAILQLGDFCIPDPKNDRFLGIWNRFAGPRYHVIGNHEMDGNHTPEDSVAFLGMPGRYYGFDGGSFRHIVLDTNDPPEEEPRRGYPAGMRADQLAWLRAELERSPLPVVVHSHQPIGRACVRNRDEILAILAAAKHPETGRKKVVACFAGHFHVDDHLEIDGIHHVIINSMSYFWMGRSHARIRYSEAVDTANPAIKYTAPYADALYTVATFDPRGEIRIEGMESEWVGPGPLDCGYPDDGELMKAGAVAPRISARRLAFAPPAGD